MNEETVAHYQNIAANTYSTVEQAIKKVVEQRAPRVPKRNKTLGAYAAESELMDRVMEIVQEAIQQLFFSGEREFE